MIHQSQLTAYQRPLFYSVMSLAWFLLLSTLMIADTWDETNGLLIIGNDPVLGFSLWEAARTILLHEIPLDIYRPIGGAAFMVLGKLSGGSYVFLRYVNAGLVVAAAYFFAASLNARRKNETRGWIFFTLLLFSSSALITAGWFANIFDATCLFFIALATFAYSKKNYALSAIALVLATFCKEIYVIAAPFFLLMLVHEKDSNYRQIAMVIIVASIASVAYWAMRQKFIPLGSSGDVHGFNVDVLLGSTASFLSGFLYQFTKFTGNSLAAWLGIVGLALVFFSLTSHKARLALGSIILMSNVIYWGMFGFSGDLIMTAGNFVARLYLVPFTLALYICCEHGTKVTIATIAAFSLWGIGTTYDDYKIFQTTYKAIYNIAEQSTEAIYVHYPEKVLDDNLRNVFIGDYPDAALQINVKDGGLQ